MYTLQYDENITKQKFFVVKYKLATTSTCKIA